MTEAALSSCRNRGFTLVEVLMAIFISALIATISYQALSTAQRTAEGTKDVLHKFNQLDRTWQTIAADLRHLLPPQPGPEGVSNLFFAESLRGDAQGRQTVMYFNRRGWLNPMERPRSDLQQVRYRVEEGVLWRDFRPHRNLPMDEFEFERSAYQQRLLEGVQDVQLRFLSPSLASTRGRSALQGENYTRDWEPTWPTVDASFGGVSQEALMLPLAVVVRIEVEHVGTIERLYEIVTVQ